MTAGYPPSDVKLVAIKEDARFSGSRVIWQLVWYYENHPCYWQSIHKNGL